MLKGPAFAFVLLALSAATPQDNTVNSTCPVKGKKFPVKANLTVAYEGQLVGFC